MIVNKGFQHFLLVYDAAKGQLREVRAFSRADRAVAAYRAAEQTFAAADGMQVVLIAADSLDTVKRTHSNFWRGESIEVLLRDALAHA